MNLLRKMVGGCALMALLMLVPGSSFGQAPPGRWIREYHAQYGDSATAERVAQNINSGNVTGWRNATAESAPHPVTRTYGVYAERFYAGAGPMPPVQQEIVRQGQLTKADPFDRLRLNMHSKTFDFPLVAGRTYTIDLMSGDGRSGPHNPGFFDTWLRIEDAQGSIKDTNDDGGENLNSRLVFVPTQSATYTFVVTSYASNVTGSFTLRIR